MLDNFEVVNPTMILWGETMPSAVYPNWKRPVWTGDREPSVDEIKTLAGDLAQYDGFSGNARGGWMETTPSDMLIVRQQRGMRIGRVSMPLGWKMRYQVTVTEILAA